MMRATVLVHHGRLGDSRSFVNEKVVGKTGVDKGENSPSKNCFEVFELKNSSNTVTPPSH